MYDNISNLVKDKITSIGLILIILMSLLLSFPADANPRIRVNYQASTFSYNHPQTDSNATTLSADLIISNLLWEPCIVKVFNENNLLIDSFFLAGESSLNWGNVNFTSTTIRKFTADRLSEDNTKYYMADYIYYILTAEHIPQDRISYVYDIIGEFAPLSHVSDCFKDKRYVDVPDAILLDLADDSFKQAIKILVEYLKEKEKIYLPEILAVTSVGRALQWASTFLIYYIPNCPELVESISFSIYTPNSNDPPMIGPPIPPPATRDHHPCPPTPIASQLSPNSVCLNWINNGDPDGDPITFGWQILRVSDGGEALMSPYNWTETNSGWRDLPAGSYTWRVKSDDGALQSNWVWGTPFTIGGDTTPAINITGATVSGLDVTLTWSSSNVTYLRIFRTKVGGDNWYTTYHPVSEWNGTFINGVDGGGTYSYKIIGYDSTYNILTESNSKTVSVGSSLNITGATVNGFDVSLTWQSSNMTYLRIFRYLEGGDTWYTTYHPVSEWNGNFINGVNAAGTYHYKLKGYDRAYNLLAESSLYTVTVGGGGGGSSMITGATVDGFDVSLTWTSCPGAPYVRIFRYKDGVNDWKTTFHPASEWNGTFTNGVLEPGIYEYKLKWYNSVYQPICETDLYKVTVGPPLWFTGAVVNGLEVALTWETHNIPKLRIYRYHYGVTDWKTTFHDANEWDGSFETAVDVPGVYLFKLKGYDDSVNPQLICDSDMITVIVGNFNFRSDIMLRLPTDGSYSGDNIYNTLIGQTKMQTVSAGATVVYHLQLQNDGTINDRFLVTGSSGQSGWTVRYFDSLTGGVDITDDMTNNGWLSPYLVAAHPL